MSEKRKIVVSHIVQEVESAKYLRYFSHFRKIVRTIAWMRRWKNYKRNSKKIGELTYEGEQEAEIVCGD